MRVARAIAVCLSAAVLLALPAGVAAQDLVVPFPSASSSYVHSGTGFINSTDVGYFWSVNRGDSVTQSFSGGPPTVDRLELAIDVRTSSLSVPMDWNVILSGLVVGSFTVQPGHLGPLGAAYDFPPTWGPHTVQIAAATEVCSGCGSVTLGYADPAVHEVRLRDTVPPDTTITEAPSGVVEGGAATVKFGSPDIDVAGFECSLDGAAFVACTSPQNYSGLGGGRHSVAVRARDGSGNADPTPASASWRADVSGPSCGDGSVTVASGAVATLTLPCADPDGDAFTLAVVTPPTIGSLGGIDQATRQVTFAASQGSAGTTTFTYKAAYGGFTSNLGTFTVNVTPPPCVPKPEVPLNGIDEDCDGRDGSIVTSTITNRWTGFAKYTLARRLAVNNLPAGATVLVLCRAKGCPYKRRSFTTQVARTKVNLVKPFKKRRLRVGGTVEIHITLTGSVGKVVRYKMRRREAPSSRVLCLAPGSSKPAKCA